MKLLFYFDSHRIASAFLKGHTPHVALVWPTPTLIDEVFALNSMLVIRKLATVLDSTSTPLVPHRFGLFWT